MRNYKQRKMEARVATCVGPQMANQVVLLNPSLATILALVGLVKDMYLHVLLIIIRPLERPVAEAALVGIAKDVGLDVCRQIRARRKAFITNATLKALLLLPNLLMLFPYVLGVVVLVQKGAVAVRTQQRLVVSVYAQMLGQFVGIFAGDATGATDRG